MGAKFCCCLPVRLGVLILSFFQSLCHGALAALCWFLIITRSDQVSHKIKVALIILGSIESLAALIALGGFIGAVFKKEGGVSLYSWMINFQFGFQLVASILAVVAFFTEPKSELVQKCVNGSSDQTVINECNKVVNASKPAIVAGVAVSLIVQLWFCWIVAAYSRQLRERHSLHTRAMMLDTSSEFKYEAARGHSQEALRPLAQHPETYAYADPAHSYGVSKFSA